MTAEPCSGKMSPRAAGSGLDRLCYVGHATVLVELDRLRILTDPVLRTRVGPLRREGPAPTGPRTDPPDLVLISHLHRDHTDLPSLRRLGSSTRLLVPSGAGGFFRRHGFGAVSEMRPGDGIDVGPLVVRAVPAAHLARRLRARRSSAVGYLIEGTRRVYFAGDTDVFDAMGSFGRPDVALLPIWGWGPNLGPGHMDPATAARAAAIIRPRMVVPIHWGTLYPRFLKHLRPGPLYLPPQEFAREIARVAPEITVRLLVPGMSTLV